MNKRERIQAAVKGQEVDRIPVSFFGHNHLMERSATYNGPYLVEKMLAYDWDFVKTQLNPFFYGQAWGCEFAPDPANRPDGLARQVKQVVNSAEDMKKLPPVDPEKNPHFAEQIELMKMLHAGFKGEVPCSHTIFSTLTVADLLAGNMAHQQSAPQFIKQLMREDPDALHAGMRTITDTLVAYARLAMRAGASGILISTTHWAVRDYMTVEEYTEFGLKYDLELFEAARDEGADLNILHICRANNLFELCADYPVDVISYESTAEGNPSLAEARKITDKCFWAGVDQRKILQDGPDEAIAAHVHEALDAVGGKGIIIGPGCAIPYHTPPRNLFVARDAARSWRRK